MFKQFENNEEETLKKQVLVLEKLLVKTKKKLEQECEYNKKLQAILDQEQNTKKSKIITIKSATKIEFVNVDNIICCNADEAYTHIELLDGKTITAAKPLSTFDKLLDTHAFFRISKSHLINTNHIITFFKDRNQILLKGDFLLNVARRRRVEFLKNLD